MTELKFLRLLIKSDNFKNFIYLFLSLILLLLSFPPFYFFPLAFFAFVPLFILIKNVKKTFLWGLIYGTIFSFFQLNWIFNLREIEKEAAFWITIGVFFIFIIHGIYFGIFTYFFKKNLKSKISFITVPLFYTLLEIIRSKTEFGFPWIVMFLTQKNNLPLIQIIEFTGPFFITFFIIFINYSIFKRDKKLVLLSVILFLFFEIYGFYLLNRDFRPFKKIDVAIYQPHIPLTSSRNEEFKMAEKIYTSLAVKDVLLSVFPESSIPSFARFDTSVVKIIKNFVKRTGSYLIFGNADAIKVKGKYKFYNTSFLVNEKGRIINYYYKTHLTPFGEALPYDEKFPILRRLQFGQGNYSRGKELRIFRIENFKVFTPICFESIFTEISREAVKKGANLLVNITSDGWFGKSLGPRVHRDLAIFRAIETRRYLVRSARSGISCVVDEKGRVLKELGLFKRGVLKSKVSLFEYKSFYVNFGKVIDIFYFIIFILLIILQQFLIPFGAQKEKDI